MAHEDDEFSFPEDDQNAAYPTDNGHDAGKADDDDYFGKEADDASTDFQDGEPDEEHDIYGGNEPAIDTTRPEAPPKKSFLGSPLGMGVVGIGVLVATTVGLVAYSNVKANQAQAEEDSAPKPTAGANIGAAVQVPAPQIRAPKPAPQQVEGLGQLQPTRPSGVEGLNFNSPAPTPRPQQASADAGLGMPMDLNGRPTPAESYNSVSGETLAPSDVIKLREALEANTAATSKIGQKVDEAQTTVQKLDATVSVQGAAQVQLSAKVDAVTAKADATQAQLDAILAANKGVLKQPAPPIKVVPENTDPKAAGRIRLAGFKIVDTSKTGKMAIVQRQQDSRLITLFEGETLDSTSGKLKVAEVVNNGALLLLGEKSYIDGELQELPLVVKQEVKPKAKPAPKRESRRESRPAPTPAPVVRKVEYVSGATVNAVIDEGRTFGIMDDKGSFEIYRVGDSYKGVGVVKGLSADGQLQVGEKLIKVIK